MQVTPRDSLLDLPRHRSTEPGKGIPGPTECRDTKGNDAVIPLSQREALLAYFRVSGKGGIGEAKGVVGVHCGRHATSGDEVDRSDADVESDGLTVMRRIGGS